MRPLNDELRQTLLAPFQASEVRIRKLPSVQPYVTARVVMTRLDEALPWQWTFTLQDRWHDASGVLHQACRLTVLSPDGPLHYDDVGIGPPDTGAAPKKQSKQAVSDAFKRCAVHIGIGRYLYALGGVTPQNIAKAGLAKALAEVGYRGPWDERHHGAIGGIRALDDEDDDPSEPETESHAPPAAAPPAARRAHAAAPAPATPPPPASADDPLADPTDLHALSVAVKDRFKGEPNAAAAALAEWGQLTGHAHWKGGTATEVRLYAGLLQAFALPVARAEWLAVHFERPTIAGLDLDCRRMAVDMLSGVNETPAVGSEAGPY